MWERKQEKKSSYLITIIPNPYSENMWLKKELGIYAHFLITTVFLDNQIVSVYEGQLFITENWIQLNKKGMIVLEKCQFFKT